MRQLLNTLFVTSEDIYLSLDGENVVANRGGETVARYPLHTLQSIVTFSYAGASPALMGKCAQREIGLAFCSQRGKFLARVSGQMQGNVLLRRMQYRVADDPPQSCRLGPEYDFRKGLQCPMERGAYQAGSCSACRWSAVFRRIPTAARTAAANRGGDLSGQPAGVGGHWRGGVFQRIG